jgi:DNA modification methylase
VFWNIGDSYNSNQNNHDWLGGAGIGAEGVKNRKGGGGLKPKDLCLIPERVALAAQADGWWVRSRILWCKPNPMPESVRDRPTDAAEHIWMFCKAADPFMDMEAVREPLQSDPASWGRHQGKDPGLAGPNPRPIFGSKRNGRDGTEWGNGSTRNLRNVWTFPTQPNPDYACRCGAVYPSRRNLDRRTMKDAEDNDRTEYRCARCLSWTDWVSHFATFPEELPRRCILAATSARGACRFCGTPWERVVEKKASTMNVRVRDTKKGGIETTPEGYGYGLGRATQEEIENYGKEVLGETRMIGWTPGCLCPGQHGRTVPCLVLDPFGGSGTTARVATELNRRAVCLDIAYAHPTGYAGLADARTRGVQRNLPI